MHSTKQILFSLFLVICTSSFSQTYSLKFSVKEIPQPTVYLFSYYSIRNAFVDSASMDDGGVFQLKLNDTLKAGLYKIMPGRDLSRYNNREETYINIILNRENVEFSTSFIAPVDSMKIISSEENKLYYDFVKKDNKVNSQMEVLSQIQVYFPKPDKFYSEIEKEFNSLQKENQNFLDALMKNNPGRFASRLIKSKRYPALEFSMPGDEKRNYILQHFFDNVDFSDTLLLHSDVFSSRSIAYIRLFWNQNLDKEQQSLEFIKAVDTLMIKSAVNDKVNIHIRNYIINGFETLDMEKVLIYIQEHYVNETSCQNDRTEINLKKRVDGYQKLAIGTPAPSISFLGNNNQFFSLSEIHSPFTLLIFWESSCSHCKVALPELKKLYENQKEKVFEVVAISIDTSKTEYLSTIQTGQYNWINYSDYKGWAGKTANDYFLFSAPAMFLLDEKKNIIYKPFTIPQLEAFFKNNDILISK